MKNLRPHTLKNIKEEFNDYLLEDGNTLRVKQVIISFSLVDVSEKDKSKKQMVKTTSSIQLVSGVIPTGEVDTKDLIENSGGPVLKDDIVKEVKFKEQKTHFNLYETDEFLIIVQTLLKKVWLTKFKDKIGNPRYNVEAEAVVDILQKKNYPTSVRSSEVKVQNG